jgi:hypothetical protein
MVMPSGMACVLPELPPPESVLATTDVAKASRITTSRMINDVRFLMKLSRPDRLSISYNVSDLYSRRPS